MLIWKNKEGETSLEISLKFQENNKNVFEFLSKGKVILR